MTEPTSGTAVAFELRVPITAAQVGARLVAADAKGGCARGREEIEPSNDEAAISGLRDH